ncbi:hypothetical protein ABPG74_004601 [Tetrahymena malaccensis]
MLTANSLMKSFKQMSSHITMFNLANYRQAVHIQNQHQQYKFEQVYIKHIVALSKQIQNQPNMAQGKSLKQLKIDLVSVIILEKGFVFIYERKRALNNEKRLRNQYLLKIKSYQYQYNYSIDTTPREETGEEQNQKSTERTVLEDGRSELGDIFLV